MDKKSIFNSPVNDIGYSYSCYLCWAVHTCSLCAPDIVQYL